MNVILYGKPKELFGIKDLLNSIKIIKNVFVFDYFPLARECIKQYDVDMIILDADDDIVGWQYLTEKFRNINRQAKIVLLSCNIDGAVRAYESGVFDYLLKPVKKKQLERVVAKS